MEIEQTNLFPSEDKSKTLTHDSHTDFLRQLVEQTLEEILQEEEYVAYLSSLQDIES